MNVSWITHFRYFYYFFITHIIQLPVINYTINNNYLKMFSHHIVRDICNIEPL